MDNEFCRLLSEKLSPEERIFKFKSAELNGHNLDVVLMLRASDYDKFLDERLKNKIKAVASSVIPSDISLNIRFYKTSADESSVINKIIEYIFKEHQSVYPIFAAAKYIFDAESDYCSVSVTLEKYVCEYVRGINLSKEIQEYLDTEFMEEVEVAFIETPNTDEKEALPEKFFVSSTRVIDTQIIKYYAKGIMNYPRYISDVIEKEKEDNSLTLCGFISDIKSRRIVKKDSRGRETEKELFTFLLNDTTASVKCKFFARPKKEFLWSDVFIDNAKLIMSGAYKYDNFENRFCFIANAVAEAEINFASINKKSNFNIDYGRYMYVLPEPFTDVAQDDFFDVDMTDLKLFEGSVYVVFDLETTGLNTENDEIIEIAAIKIVDGQFTEKFSTFVKPENSIPKRITEITHIDDETVADAPKLSEVIPDFYRFVKDCTLVGHNISTFDIPLLNAQSAKVKYEFDNNFIDTLVLAKNKLKLSKYKLGDVCSALNVNLVGAHRAINDVAANAQVFLKLMKLKNK